MAALILIASVMVGPLLVRFFKLQDRKKIRLLTTFSGAYVFSITALHLMPEAFAGGGGHDGHDHAHAHGLGAHLPGALILAGFFFQLILDYFSHGIEHGHAHAHGEHGQLPVGILTGLCVHAFLEGMPLGAGHEGNILASDTRNALIMGIAMHNIPVSVVLMTLFVHQGLKMRTSLMWMSVFALMSPLGMWLSGEVEALAHYGHELMAIVVGIFLHISTTILFETGEEHRFNRMKAVAIALGAALAALGVWLQPHAH